MFACESSTCWRSCLAQIPCRKLFVRLLREANSVSHSVPAWIFHVRNDISFPLCGLNVWFGGWQVASHLVSRNQGFNPRYHSSKPSTTRTLNPYERNPHRRMAGVCSKDVGRLEFGFKLKSPSHSSNPNQNNATHIHHQQQLWLRGVGLTGGLSLSHLEGWDHLRTLRGGP